MVWKDGYGNPIIDTRQSYGYFSWNACKKSHPFQRPPQYARLKLGIYKDIESGKAFEIQYDDIKIGNTYSSVKPW